MRGTRRALLFQPWRPGRTSTKRPGSLIKTSRDMLGMDLSGGDAKNHRKGIVLCIRKKKEKEDLSLSILSFL